MFFLRKQKEKMNQKYGQFELLIQMNDVSYKGVISL